MGDIVPFNSRMFLGAYCEAQKSERIPEGALFFIGVILTVVLPQIVYSAYSGFIPPIIFIMAAIVGTSLGIATYYQLLSKFISYVRARNVPQAPPSGSITLKKAA